MARKLLALAAVLLVAITGVNAERTTPHASSKLLRDVLTDTKYEPSNLADVDAEFVDFDELHQVGSGRRLQSTETTTKCNTWCKLKESLGLTIIGLLLICISPCLMWKNEGRHVNELRRIDFCKNKAVVVNNADIPDDENTGQLVHFVGKVSVDEDTLDLHPGALNITTPLPKALIIKRTCMIYQKFEESSQQVKNDVIGAGQTTTTTFTVREDWTPMGPQPERLEHLPEETNTRGIWDELVSNSGTPESAAPSPSYAPPNLPPQLAAMLQQTDLTQAPHGISMSKSAHVGGFGLTEDVITTETAVFQSEWMPLPADMIPDEIEALPELRKDRYGNLTTVEEGDQPTNGDVMIKYEYVADGFDASFIVQQVLAESDPETGVPAHKFSLDKQRVLDEKCCGKISDDLGVIWMVRRGRHDLYDMIKMAKEDENMVTKILRLICWVLLVAGWMMLFSIFTTLLSTLPILGALGNAAFFIVALIIGTVCCCGVTAIAYIRYRPLVAFGILAIAGTIFGIVFGLLGDASESSISPTPAPVKSPSFLYSDDTDVMVDSMY
mmetsp:Transcript_32075/g.67428  ORF Transcript_32075/g.67428 Transcript_32075/m.67428 type:complete len:554 (-) Transcript_32075:236-1897(-)